MMSSFLIVAGVLTPLEDALRSLLDWLHNSGGLPYAWAIVATTVIVRVVLVPLTVRQIHSMQRLQSHAPEMKAIQQKYKHDKQKQNEELMKFYKENNINPAASCLPLLAQFPVFIALYYVLRNFAKEAEKPAHHLGDLSWLHFIPNIADAATAHWGGYLLLVVYVASQMASTLYMSATIDKTQRIIFMLMPLVFVFVIAHFPAGLVLYWMTTNLWTVGQGLITRRMIPKTAAPSPFSRAARARPADEGGDQGDGAKQKPPAPKPAPAAKAPQQQRPVRRKKRKARR